MVATCAKGCSPVIQGLLQHHHAHASCPGTCSSVKRHSSGRAQSKGSPSALWLGAGLACSAHSPGGNFACERYRCSPYSFGAPMGSEIQVSLRVPVWKCRTLLDCSDNERQDPESPIACLAQQEPGLMELLSCQCDNFCSGFQL